MFIRLRIQARRIKGILIKVSEHLRNEELGPYVPPRRLLGSAAEGSGKGQVLKGFDVGPARNLGSVTVNKLRNLFSFA